MDALSRSLPRFSYLASLDWTGGLDYGDVDMDTSRCVCILHDCGRRFCASRRERDDLSIVVSCGQMQRH
jgi:hypothetical protein